MSLSSVLARGRAAAQAIMTDTCTIRRVTNIVTNHSDGTTTKTRPTIYTGRCRVQQVGPGGNMPGGQGGAPGGAGEQTTASVSYTVQLPLVGTENVYPNDQITIDTCPGDASLVGRVLIIGGMARASHKTARRLDCTEVL